MTRLIALALGLGAALFATIGAANAEKRAALVVGINAYDAVYDLEKAVGDARAMAGKLRSLGFEVTELFDADRRTFNQAISSFAASLADVDTAFVHFSGHGIEIDGENYLLPADIPKPESGQRNFVKSEAIPMTGLIAEIAEGGARIRVFVIDACRNNPFEEAGVRAIGGTRGLARVEAPAGTFIMYSAGYRQQALDRLGPDDAVETSIYTRALLKHLGTAGKAIDDIAQDVRGEVEVMARGIGHAQRPAYYDELSTRLVLVAAEASAAESGAVQALRPATDEAAARAWAATRETTSVAVLESFIRNFPGTVYADMAAARIGELKDTRQEQVAALSAEPPAESPSDLVNDLLGIRIAGITDELREKYGIADDIMGIVITGVEKDSGAETRGLREGDVILEVSQLKVQAPRELVARITQMQEENRRLALLLLARGENLRFVALPFR